MSRVLADGSILYSRSEVLPTSLDGYRQANENAYLWRPADVKLSQSVITNFVFNFSVADTLDFTDSTDQLATIIDNIGINGAFSPSIVYSNVIAM